MHSPSKDMLPPRIRRSLAKLGHDISLARRKRGLSVAMMIERIGVAKQTLQRVEKGDPSVAMGIYAMCVFVLGLGDKPFDIADPSHDEQGLLIDAEKTPKRIRLKKKQPTR